MIASSTVRSPSPTLSPRVRRLRQEFFSFDSRDYFRNEVRPYTSGLPWDAVWSPHSWTVVPELYPFLDAYQDSLLAAAFVERPVKVLVLLLTVDLPEQCR